MSPHFLAGDAIPDGTIILAGDSNLRQGWDQGPGRILASGFGHTVSMGMAILAACIACLLAVAFLLKIRGSQSPMVSKFTGDGKTVAAVILLILLLAAPGFLLPLTCSCLDLLLNALKPIIESVMNG